MSRGIVLQLFGAVGLLVVLGVGALAFQAWRAGSAAAAPAGATVVATSSPPSATTTPMTPAATQAPTSSAVAGSPRISPEQALGIAAQIQGVSPVRWVGLTTVQGQPVYEVRQLDAGGAVRATLQVDGETGQEIAALPPAQ
jgi:hypothetical protein